MVATSRFKKDFGYYFLGVLAPGLLNAALIPILKRLLGTENFGAYSLKFSFLLLLMATLLGGLCQAVVRFKAGAEDGLDKFYARIFSIGWRLLLPGAAICFFVLVYYFHQSVLLSVFYGLCILGCGLQNMAMAISQASFQSRYLIFTESTRAVVFFLLAIFILLVFPHNQEAYLFLALFVSYFISCWLLFKKNRVNWKNVFGISSQTVQKAAIDTKVILMYGLPLILWFSAYYLILYLDKPLIAKHFGLKVQGNYQAMSDIVFRGITFLLAPISTAIFPILNQSGKQNSVKKEFQLLKKIFVLEIGMLLVCVLIYWYFGFALLTELLNMPNSHQYKIAGALIIGFSVVWQMAMIAHKPLEIAKKTNLMFVFILVALCVYLVSFFALRYFFFNQLFAYSFPCLLAGIVYNIECIFFYFNFSNKTMRRI